MTLPFCSFRITRKICRLLSSCGFGVFCLVMMPPVFSQQLVPGTTIPGQVTTPLTSQPGQTTNRNSGTLPSMTTSSLSGQVPPPASYTVGGAPQPTLPPSTPLPPAGTQQPQHQTQWQPAATVGETAAARMSERDGLVQVAPNTPSNAPANIPSNIPENGSGNGRHGAPQPVYTNQTTGEVDPVLGARVARVTQPSGSLQLPAEQGQIWREYDITPYSGRPSANQKPETALVNWLVRQVGQTAWHTEPFGFMSATRDKLTVYHTPEMQMFVADIVDRFVNPRALQDAFALRIITLGTPDWRNKANSYMRPIPIQTPGVQGWLIGKDNLGLFLDGLTRRNDYHEHVPSHTMLINAQTTTIPYFTQRNYVRDVQVNTSVAGGYITDPSTLSEGFQFQITPLMRLDGATADVMLKCDFVQVDKMNQLVIDTPTTGAPGGRTTIEVPQVANFKVDEMINWPRDSVLVLDLGMVPMLLPVGVTKDKNILARITDPLTTPGTPKRSNVLVLLEVQPSTIVPTAPMTPGSSTTPATQPQ